MSRPKILFVCVENSCRSQMAEGFARAYGGGSFDMGSAGSRPSGKVNPRAIEMMAEKGISLARATSKGLESLPAITWDFVITMGCGDDCPRLAAKERRDWDIPDPKNESPEAFRRIRDRIEEHVRCLLNEALMLGESK